jgi:gamma-glutamyltranspeptidase / glutathione hydrolase
VRPDIFPLDARGNVRGAINQHGWLAAGVPGTLAGLQLALDRFGTLRLERAIEPAIRYARDGFVLDAGQARAIQAAWPQLQRDPASARLFAPDGKPLVAGQTLRNPDLSVLLERLAKDSSVATFYRGEIAEHIAREFKRHDGLVAPQDLARYDAREVLPLSLEWRGVVLHTAPLTAGGLSVLQAMATLKALSWQNEDAADPHSTHTFVEALRLAWHDRLAMLGDPTGGDDPSPRLLSTEYAAQAADRIRQAVREKRLIPGKTDGRAANGTIHLSAADKTGVMAALTLTHGEGFGARVTVDGLGMVLGHGMSRFDPRPGHPNSVGPFRRPLNNMCPTIVFRGDQPILAAGATGGRRIPNTMYSVLVDFVARDSSLAAAYAVPRLHTEGDAVLQLSKGWKDADTAHLKQVGYTIQSGTGANLNAVQRNPLDGLLTSVP